MKKALYLVCFAMVLSLVLFSCTAPAAPPELTTTTA